MRVRLYSVALGVAVGALVPSTGSAQSCTPRTYTRYYCDTCRQGDATWTCWLAQGALCGSGAPTGDPRCAYEGCVGGPTDCISYDSSYYCTPSPETCSDPSGDRNCNGVPNENCAPCKTPFASGRQNDEGGNCCYSKAGADPILLSSRAAATEPFTDVSVDRISRLSITRTYNSSDFDLTTIGTGGAFRNAWHHDWEAYVTCQNDVCTVMRGTLSGFTFALAGTYLSNDGSETWSVYLPNDYPYAPVHHNVLVERPSGEWIAFLADGRELHFAQVCGACDMGNPVCTSAHGGGRARLVSVVDEAGNRVSVTYDSGQRVLLKLTDDLGHNLELRSAQACDTYASELRYDGVAVAHYSSAGNMLSNVTDADGHVLRSYVYGSIGQYWPRLKAVVNESGAAVAEFSYESHGNAIGVIDASSSVGVEYSTDGRTIFVTEYFRGPNGDTSSSTTRELDYFGRVVNTDSGCSCGAAGRLSWTPEGHLSCSIDAEGHATYQEFDGLGRVTHRVEYFGDTCGVPNPLPADAREEWMEYGATKTVAQGVTLYLDVVTRSWKRSGRYAGGFAEEISDYDQAPAAIDPAGYVCAASPLPSGSVLCRRKTTGYVTRNGTPVLERYVTFFSYDSRGRLVRTYGPVSLDHPGPSDVPPIEEREYWGDGDTSERQGRLRQVKRYPSPSAAPLVTTYDYDMFGISRVTQPDGASTFAVKDGRGRPTFVMSADKVGNVRATSETRYYEGLIPRLRVLPSGATERYTYDSKGRRVSTEYLSGDPEASGATPTLGWAESNVYDQAGNRIHSERRDAQGLVKWQQDLAYDVQHRVVWESNPAIPSATKSWTYYPSGFLSGTLDEEGRGVSFTPDGLNRVQKVRRTGRDAQGNPAGADVAIYQFAATGDVLSSVTGGNGRPTSYTYDDFGRIERVTSATLSRGGGVAYGYDARGNVVTRSDSTIDVSYAYDGLDRVISMNAHNSADGSAVTYAYAYDEEGFAGHLTSIVEPARTVRFTYDWAGRLWTEVVSQNGVAVPFTTQYAYDSDGALRQLTYPSGLAVQFDRDPATREVVAVRNVADGTGFVSSITRYPGGPIAGLTYANGRTLAQTFNLRYEPIDLHSGPLWLTYTPSPAGDIAVAADRSEDPTGCVHDRTRTFKYDFQDRLSGWSDAVKSGTGTCGGEGIGALAAAFTYVDGTDLVASQLSPDLAGKPAYAFGYDGQGNISAIGQYDATGTSIAQAVCLRHDALGRMVLVGTTSASVTPGGTACVTDADVTAALARFEYDARNRRVARQVDSQWTHTVFDAAGNPLSEFALTSDPAAPWAKVRDYVWLEGRLLAQIEYTQAGAGPAYAYYAHLDHLGTPRMLTNPAGELVWSTFQRPYGEIGEKTKTDPVSGQVVVTNLRLPGQYDERLLGSLGLQGPYYNWNRWYLPGVGRYLEVDPLALQGGLNGHGVPDWYNYALGNPLRYTDHDGAIAVMDDVLVLWGAAALVLAWETYVVQCTAAGTCPWSPKKCEPVPWNPPRVEPFPLAPPRPSPRDGDPCDAQYNTDLATCRGVSRSRGPSAAARCYSSAMERLVACQSGKPIPPLDVWNN